MFTKKYFKIAQVVFGVTILTKVVYGGIACLNNPCLNGICIDDVNSSYACYCVDGYTGVQCQTNWDECWSDPCLNGGTCIDGIASYNCSCPDGFIGENCETNYNECESNPCENNGTCIDLTNGYMCACAGGYSGEHCEVDAAVCNSTEVRCHNGGQCIEGPGLKFYCKCMAGWAGPHCEMQIDECESDPCQNGGVCIDVYADYMCACTYGFTGKSCEEAIEFCDDGACDNGALCVVHDGLRTCYCVPDYHGERCQLQYDECALGPRCMNGGTCIDGVDNFTCSCPPKLTGSLCECLILDNSTYDCDYVSPSPFPDTTNYYTSTFIYDKTTELTTAGSMYNDTDPRIPTSTEAMTTLLQEETMTTTEKSTTDITTTEKEPTTSKWVETTEMTKETIESDDSKQETTTICKDDCRHTTTDTVTSDMSLTTTESILDTTESELTTLTSAETTTSEVQTTTAVTTTFVEVTSTKLDVTTEKMFTDSPTEEIITDAPTPPMLITTESIETTTVFDNTTNVYTTIQSDCTESFCNNNGVCTDTPHGVRCHCSFNYKGKFCEDKILITSAAFGGNSFITHKIMNSTSTAIGFNAKTLISDGQIMHVDIAKGVYMQLYMNSGLLQFKFSCGYQTMLLSELKTFVNKGYPMKIEARLDLFTKEQYCNATLRLNNTVAMSGGQMANITSLQYTPILYLGNAPLVQDEKTKPFIGCITDLMVNGQAREVFGSAESAGNVAECSSLSCLSAPCLNGGSCSDTGHGYTCSCSNGWIGDHCNQSVCDNNPCQSGGSCIKHPGSGFLCLCPYGKHGIFCEYSIEISRPSLAPISNGISSYLIYPLSPSAINTDRFDLRLRFQTTDMDQIALLAFIGQNGRHDSRSQHMAVTFVKGYIMLTWNMGGGARRIFTQRAISARRGGHIVRVWRRGRTATLSVDGRLNATGNAPAADTRMAAQPYLYIGGHPSEGFVDLPHDLPLHSGWRGCLWEVGGQGVGGGVVGGRGVGQCGVAQCSPRSCNAPRGVCIHSPATYGCICNEGWFGARCSLPKSPCDRSVSLCRGSCIITSDRDAECDCPYGKIGKHCDQDLIPTDVFFTGSRSFAQMHPRPVTSVSLAIEAEIKPAKERGLIAVVQTPHFHAALSLQGGLLEFRWMDRVSGVTSVVRSSAVVGAGAEEWAGVRAGRYGARLYVWAAQALATHTLAAHAYPHTVHNATVLLGGAKDLSTLPFDAMSGPPESFTGCIRNFHLDNVLILLEEQNIREGRNLADCDGKPCGAEACGNSACVVEEGQARCACASTGASGSSASGRCRRHTVCSPKSCFAPGGVCRDGACVCATGYAGADCDRKINITIPQFNGKAFLSLSKRAMPGVRASEQKLMTRPSYIALNFTTAELNGLLLWMSMSNHYIGLGLENGYLKLAWNYFYDNSTIEVFNIKSKVPETSKKFTRLVPQVGFLADAEWHLVVLQVSQKNVTVTIDTMLAHVEEPGPGDAPDDEEVDVFIGGVTTKDGLVKNIFPNNFKGCMELISARPSFPNVLSAYSENLDSCQLFP